VLADPDRRNELRRVLADDRLLLPLVDEAEPNDASSLPSVRVAANVVVHRATLRAAATRANERTADGVHRLPGGTVRLGPAATKVDPQSTSDGPDDLAGAAGPYGFDPIVVFDQRSAQNAERALLRSLRKPQDGWTATHLNRPMSLWLTRRLAKTPLSPNQISVAILGIGLLGAVLASRGGYGAQLVGALLFQAQSVLDGCDGEVSRLTFRGSRTGEWLDTIGDDLTNYGFFAGASWGLYAATARPLYLGLGLVTVLSGLIGSGLEYRYLIRIGSGDLLKYPIGIGKAAGQTSPKTAAGRAVDAISPLFKRDTFVLLTLLGAALGWLGPFLAAFAAGATAVLAAVVRAELAMRRGPSGDEPGRCAPPAPRAAGRVG
jgi:phosphatidylglycerophosphate synthase